MDDIRIYRKVDLKNPVMIAGWPGMGSVALGVVDYLRKALRAVKFAEIKTDPFTTLDSVSVENGLASLPAAPRNTFYYTRSPDLILFEGEAQLPGQTGITLLNEVLDFAVQLKVRGIYAGAAFPLPVSYKERPEIFGAANEKALMNSIRKFGVHPMEGGHISGLNGLVLGFAKEKGIEAACLLATMPQYAISLPNPKASAAIIEVLCKILGLEMDMHRMNEYVKDMDEKMALIEDKVKDVLTIEKEQGHPASTDRKIPAYIMQKVERLFKEAKADKTKAIILKKELDRWDLYKVYEDRFLDLFSNNQQAGS